MTATPWMIWISCTALKSRSRLPKISALTTMPSSSIT